ncbi:cation diffusion facilitator family transporter [Granulibacter bethesdensis]|uniref:Cation efflux system protein n=1 Tax=Granulibacter bethesdensis TaxID=364410 RepID=A0AAN0RCI4_9PROT|nr:cation diffusion facilitator family transporter [Granulibacter bethesdensis]AHJ62269.1 Cation efflux system protein [Granulibacter bethesdensis]AHJ64899.1 Cation efflux system protein [Granulibacter bethesdensis CGDNIH4]AHJ67518.1 Cation efflux system protein [Granulibacter bethesdensis]
MTEAIITPASHSHTHHNHGHAGHDHGALGHSHGAGVKDERRLALAGMILTVFLGAEIVGGLLSGSLALLADAGHMVSDVLSLLMGWAALRIGRRPSSTRHSYGFRRLEVLAAFVNGSSLLIVSIWIVIEAVRRLLNPQPIGGGLMLAVAAVGLVANAISLLILNEGRESSLNMRGVWLHVLSDLFGFAAAILAALIIMITGWVIADPLLSLIFAAMILRGAVSVVKGSAHVLLQGTPADIDLDAIASDLVHTIPGVQRVHHLHAWSLTGNDRLITLHAVTGAGEETSEDRDRILDAIQHRLSDRFGISHATVQMETGLRSDDHPCRLSPLPGQVHHADHDHNHD